MNLLPQLFRDPQTGKAVRAVFFPHNPNIGETVKDDCFVTFPASNKELLNVPEQSLTGIWSSRKFQDAFKPI